MELDTFDRKILFALDTNARMTTTEMGKRLRKSKQFVDFRIKRMEQNKVLPGYITVIDYSKLGYISVRVYFKFHNITPQGQEALEQELIQDSEVWWLATVQGPWDVCYATAVKNVLDFYPYWDNIMTKHRKYISKYSVVLYTHIRQYPKSYLIHKENNDQGTLIGASKQAIRADSFDIQLLKILSGSGRMSLLDISAHLHSSPQVVKNHIKKLEEQQVILGYRALIDVSFLGYNYYKSYITLLNTVRINELNQFCLQHPNILNVNRTIGGRDFEIELQVQSFDEFDTIMRELRTRFDDMIDDYEFVIVRQEKKMVYFPFD